MFTGTAVALLLDLRELAGDVRSVAVQHRRVAVADLPRVVQHDHLRTRTPSPHVSGGFTHVYFRLAARSRLRPLEHNYLIIN